MIQSLQMPVARRPEPLRWTGEEFERASNLGAFGERRVELINGEILEMPPMHEPHAHSVQLVDYALRPIFPPTQAVIRIQLPTRLGEHRLFPDVLVAKGTPRSVRKHPETAILIVEISDSTLDYDREEKGPIYAAHGVADYWIVDVVGRRVEVRRKPLSGRRRAARYAEVQIYGENETLSPLSAPGEIIKVMDLLPTVLE